MSDKSLLIGDIGGTNARFALTNHDMEGYHEERILKCADYESSESAISAFLEMAKAPAPTVICLAAAGPAKEGEVDLTNNHWLLRESSLKKKFDVTHARLLNDFEAIAYSLPTLTASDLITVGLKSAHDLSSPNFNVGAIGPGTGLGAAGLIRRDGYTMPIITEAGHVGFAPETALQTAVWEVLRHRFGRVSDERLISGKGVENIYFALAEIYDEPSVHLEAAEIFEQMNDNAIATESINLFFEILGQVAGNFALAHGAYDGIYIAGGIVQRYPLLLHQSSFRASFENKGRHRHIMEQIPTLLVQHPQLGLLGASVIAKSLTRSI